MSKYYKSKPYWARPEDWVTRKPSGAKQPVRPVLEATRQPSGEFAFNGEVYTPPAKNASGRRSGRSVPDTRPSGMDNFRKMNMMKQRMSSFMNKANVAMAVADLMGDPHRQQQLLDYGWDDFMEGRLPPPFDFLNSEIPAEWLPTRQADVEVPMPEGTFYAQSPDGRWYGIPPAFALTGAHIHRNMAGVPTAWPPPGRLSSGTISGAVKYSKQNLTLPAWDQINEDLTQNWYAGWHDIQDNGSAAEKTWSVSHQIYSLYQGSLGTRGGYVGSFGYHLPRSDDVRPPAPELLNLPVSEGDTLEEASVRVTPGAIVMSALPVPYRWAHPYANLIRQVAGARMVDFGDVDPVGQGGTKTIAAPGGPIYTVPVKTGEPPHPPGNGTKERKRLVGGKMFFFTQKLFHGITEYQDLLDALFEALPKELRKQFKSKGPIMKSAFVWHHLDKVDIGDAIVNIAWNQFEDYVIGTQLFGRNKRAAEARGDRYAFRTLNSANDYGGLNALGEAYGEFSKEYVNPKKEDLKRFLTERFGI